MLLHALLEEDLQWDKVEDAGEVGEDALNTTRSFVKAVGHQVPILKKGYLALGRVLTKRVQKAQLEFATTTRNCLKRIGQ